MSQFIETDRNKIIAQASGSTPRLYLDVDIGKKKGAYIDADISAATTVVVTSGFTPASISGLRLWYDLSDVATITKDGSNIISAVADKSGNGYAGAGSGGLLYVANAKNGLSVAQFGGTNSQIRTTAGIDLTAFSAALVAMPSSVVRYKLLLGASVKPNGQLNLIEEFNATDSALGVFGLPATENTVTPQNSFVASNFYQLLWTYAGGVPGLNTIYINGVSSGTGNIASGKLYTNDLTIGYDAGSNGWFGFAGQMGEIVVYDHVLSAPDQVLLNNYLQAKWT